MSRVGEHASTLRRASQGEVHQLMHAHPLLALLRASTLESLSQSSALLFLDAGEPLYEAGQSAGAVFVLLDGALQIEYPQPDGKGHFVAAMLPAPGFLGECQALHGRAWSGTGVTLFPSTVLALPPARLEALLVSEPAFALAAYRDLSGRFLGAIEAWKLQQRATHDQVVARYVLSYLEVARLAGRVQGNFIPLSQSALATATASRRETINRLLRDWELNGLVRNAPRGLDCLDPSGLARLLPERGQNLLVQRLTAESLVSTVAS